MPCLCTETLTSGRTHAVVTVAPCATATLSVSPNYRYNRFSPSLSWLAQKQPRRPSPRVSGCQAAWECRHKPRSGYTRAPTSAQSGSLSKQESGGSSDAGPVTKMHTKHSEEKTKRAHLLQCSTGRNRPRYHTHTHIHIRRRLRLRIHIRRTLCTTLRNNCFCTSTRQAIGLQPRMAGQFRPPRRCTPRGAPADTLSPSMQMGVCSEKSDSKTDRIQREKNWKNEIKRRLRNKEMGSYRET